MAESTIWFKRWRVAACAALFVLGAALSMASPAIAKTVPQGNGAQTVERLLTVPTGAASVFGIDDGGVISESQSNINLAAATGVNWERISLYWRNLEATEGVYDFSSADPKLVPLMNAGFSLIVYIDKNPTWASNTECGPVYPDKVAAFAKLYSELVKRYPGVRVWSAYNEVDFDDPNLDLNTGGCFGARSPHDNDLNNNGKQDYQDYAEMLAAGWKAVHDADTATGNDARFSMGAVAYDNFNPNTAPAGYPGKGNGGLFNFYFASDLFKYMKNTPLPSGQKYMDMVLFNYYNIYGPYWQTKASGYGIQAKTKVLRNLMTGSGIEAVPLFVTETGEYSASKNWIDLKGQARCLNMTMARAAAAKLTGVIWWTFRDFPDSSPPPQNTWKYGIVNQNLQPKPSYAALTTLATELNGLDYSKTVTNKSGFTGVEAYYFTGGGVKKYVVWGLIKPNPPAPWVKPECAWPRYSNLAKFKAGKIRVVNYLGVVKTITDNSKKDKDPAAGSIAVKAGADPLIVQINPQ